MTDITMRQMFEAGVHYGHQARYWCPEMAPYIYGVKDKIHIINLDKTLPLYQAAINFAGSVIAKRGKILFVGTKPIVSEIISEEAKRCNMPYVNYRWLGGMLTNYKTIRQSIKRLKDLEEFRDSPVFNSLSKKEALSITRDIAKLERSLGGIRNMNGLPDAIFVVDIGHDKIAVSEAAKLRIPIIGVVDTNHSPRGIDYIIPGNDDSARALKLYVQGIADIIATVRSTLPVEVEEKEIKKITKKPPRTGKKVPEHKVAEPVVEDIPVGEVKDKVVPVIEEENEPQKAAHKVVKIVRKPVATEKKAEAAKPKRTVKKVAAKPKLHKKPTKEKETTKEQEIAKNSASVNEEKE